MDTINFTEAFGLTNEQTSILFALEKLIAYADAKQTKDITNRSRKEAWTDAWINQVNQNSILNTSILNSKDIHDLASYCREELNKSPIKTWYYLLILEATTFVPYFSLPTNSDDHKGKISKLEFSKQSHDIQTFVNNVGIGATDIVERYEKAYKNALDKGTEKNKKIFISIATVVIFAAITAATAGALSGPLATALVGSQFAGLSGAALTSACLAYLGGGAIAVGGAGMAGGAFVIVGGGALLGGAIGGSSLAVGKAFAKESPGIMLSQAAKLDVVMREIILNTQKDVKMAQEIISNYREQIADLTRDLSKLKTDTKEQKEQIKNLKNSIKYMENILKDMNKFNSAFGEGFAHV